MTSASAFSATSIPRATRIAIVVAALGYFVDMFDLVLFSILRIPSLKALGVTSPAEIDATGAAILNMQLGGMLLGGLFFGALGDRFGRLKTLFGSILLYSLANLANAYVPSVPAYMALRFVAGFGLAGELGSGVTLVSELLPTRLRGLGTTVVASVGLFGAIGAGAAAQWLSWQNCYLVGGVCGLALLALRVGVVESGVFERTRKSDVSRGNPLQLLWPPERLGRFVLVVLSGMPIWYVGGVVFVFAPLLGREMGIAAPILPPRVILWAYVGVVLGDVVSGVTSQFVRSRVLVIRGFIVLLALALSLFLTRPPESPSGFYAWMTFVGFATGYWAIFVTTGVEQFGTNLRATAATSSPNFVRATAVPLVALWFSLKASMPVLRATLTLGLACCAIGLIAAWRMRDSFDRDLDWIER